MHVDKTRPVTPHGVAIYHYKRKLKLKYYQAWYGVVRERGRVVRLKEKIFKLWSIWAPNQKKISQSLVKTLKWLKIKKQRDVFNTMIAICVDVIDKRTTALKKLRMNLCDRKIVICAYAFLNKNSHVLMVDCWRKFLHYFKCRKNWKNFRWQYNFQWFLHKTTGF
jgi:hypothetical protein